MKLEEAMNICKDFCEYKDLIAFNINDLSIYQEAVEIVLKELDSKKNIEELYAQCLCKKVNDDILKELINNIGDKVK